MLSDRIRVKKSKYFSFTLPTGQTVLPYNSTLSTDGTGQETLPPLELNEKLYLGTCNTGVTWAGSHNRFRPTVISGVFGQVPSASASSYGQYLYGLRGPMARHALVRGFAWVPSVGNIGGGAGVNLVRLGGADYYATAANGSSLTVSAPYALGPWNKVALAQGVADALITFSIASDGTASYDGARALPIGATPNGVGAVVVSPSGTKVLAFGRDLENRNQICQSTDAITYAALPEAAISAGNPLRVIDAVSIPAAGTRPAAIVVSCLLAGVPRILRSVDDGVSYTLIALDSAGSAAPWGHMILVNGVLFCFHQSRWYYSLDHGGTWVIGSASVVQPRGWIMTRRYAAIFCTCASAHMRF
ncbi:hypothetical protein VZ95_11225 [Elstera litoralis]|uniref:Uncharacterized protein n=1 Tax=Elstera litoralis TaxID=552518 RepID=A0A0F3IRV3_9PROT|nr:hypothetical protein [Elstera litoralis]KJV09480.1 hypothetical protein VZ95_11225 [Elstera litoralis]